MSDYPDLEVSETPTDESPSSANHVRELSLALYDTLAPLHGKGGDLRRILDASTRGEDAVLQEEFSIKERRLLRALQAARAEGGRAEAVSLADGHWRLTAKAQKQACLLLAILNTATSLNASGGELKPPILLENGMILVISRPQTEQDAAAEEHVDWAAAGLPGVRVMSEAKAKNLLAVGPAGKPGVLPEDPLPEAGRKVWRSLFAEMLRHEDGTRLGEDIEALHDMRVATRRMRAAYEVFGGAFQKKDLKPHLQGLRAAGRALGGVRDLDVFMEKAHHYLESLPPEQQQDLDPLLEAWGKARVDAREVMLAHLDSTEYAEFKQRFQAFLNTPGAGVCIPAENVIQPIRVRELAPALVYERLGEARAYGPLLDVASIEQLHALRIEFKKLRYTVEFFREVLGPEAKDLIALFKRMQDHLGDLHDAQVATQLLRAFLDEQEAKQDLLPLNERRSLAGVATYLAYQHTELHRLIQTFCEQWAEFDNADFRRNLALAVSAL